MLEGPAGIGKSHLWREVGNYAEAEGCRVLRAQPAQAELRLVGSALIDLCDAVTDAELAELPQPQAAALSAALLRTTGEAAQPHAVAFAFTTLVRRLAAEQPVLLCIDDVQWLDAQTAGVLAFSCRRLPPAGVGLLLTLRTELGEPPPDLVGDFAAGLHLSRRSVRPMTEGELEQVMRERLGGAVPHGVIRAAVTSAGGNPLFGLELARALLARGADSPLESVPIPESLADLIGRHIVGLPEPTRVGLAAASAMRRPSLRHLRVLGVADSLDAAERAGLIRIDGRTVSFTHPLYAAAAYDGLPLGERMRLHARIAEVVEGEEERARHLALAADEADEQVAAALDVARDRAMRRGALDAALDASRLALRATPAGSPSLTARRIHLGNLLFRAGETDRARRELTLAADGTDEPLHKARALHALARVVNDTEGPAPAMPLELQALSLGAADPSLAADIHMGIAVSNSDDWGVALQHACTARELLEGSDRPDPLQMAAALSAEVGARFYSGGGADFASCRRAIELQGNDISLPVSDRAVSVLFYLQIWTDDFLAARKQLEYAYRLAVDEGDEPSRCYILSCQVQLEVRSGLWERADQLIDACIEAAQTSQNPYYARVMDTQRAWLTAYRGGLDAATRAAEEEIRRGQAAGHGLIEQRGRALRGWCALARGDAQLAATDLDRYATLFDENNTGEPALRLVASDHVEALVLAGRLHDAEQALGRLVEPAARLARTAVLAGAARAEAVLRAEQGDLTAAVAAAERSLELYDSVERRFDRARALLTKGQVHRRFKQKSLAKRELTAALDAFEQQGAHGFAERTATELARIGLRPAAATELTETERRIAELAAKGHTSAEIAGTLFLSTKTVSANLTRIYRKLNVRNRSELTALLAARG